jgi:hypothetical protein
MSHNAKTTPADRNYMRKLYATGRYSQNELSRIFGLRQPRVNKIVNSEMEDEMRKRKARRAPNAKPEIGQVFEHSQTGRRARVVHFLERNGEPYARMEPLSLEFKPSNCSLENLANSYVWTRVE